MTEQTLPKPKKSVALSGVAAGNTALCTVGRSGNDLHYRGYDIHDLAAKGCFEEVAHLLVYGVLPFAPKMVVANIDVAILYIVAIGSATPLVVFDVPDGFIQECHGRRLDWSRSSKGCHLAVPRDDDSSRSC